MHANSLAQAKIYDPVKSTLKHLIQVVVVADHRAFAQKIEQKPD
jgi:hypothetical protein